VVTSFGKIGSISYRKIRQKDIIIFVYPKFRPKGTVTVDVDGFWKLKKIVIMGDF
jgi:hypothetical protein